jgi:hypothetical protein
VAQAIITRYHGWTNTKPAYLSATSASGIKVKLSLSEVSGDSSDYDSHEQVARKLMEKLDWSGEIIGGGLKEGYAFVFTGK